MDSGGTHSHVHVHGLLQQKVVVAAVEEPCYRAQSGESLLIGLLDESDGRMSLDSFAYEHELVLLGIVSADLSGLIVQPWAHGVAAGKHFGMSLAIDGAAASAHGEAHHGPHPFRSAAVVLLFDLRDKFPEEEILVVPARHVEIAVPCIMDVRTSGVRHDYYHLPCLSGTDQFVDDSLHPALDVPGAIVVAEPMEKIDHWVGSVFSAETVREIDVICYRLPEDVAWD